MSLTFTGTLSLLLLNLLGDDMIASLNDVFQCIFLRINQSNFLAVLFRIFHTMLL